MTSYFFFTLIKRLFRSCSLSAVRVVSSAHLRLGLSGGSVVRNLPANAGDMDLVPGWGRSPGGGNGNPLLYPCLENPMDRGAWRVQSMGS